MQSIADIDTQIPSTVESLLEPEEWNRLQHKHEAALSPVLDPYLENRSRQVKDPVLDFLFEYYHFRPSHLRRWSPGIRRALSGNGSDWPEISELTLKKNLAFLDPRRFPDNRKESAAWILKLLEKSSTRKPSFGCFGMHEWAMVYRAGEVRHNQLPLRMGAEELAGFVESRPLVCTHFDAYRFFTHQARPLNKFELCRDTFIENEQPGCIHTNMDLYKWGFKMYPWISSDIIRKAFLLAVEARRIDMQASPYDLREKGLDPICIETEKGREEYLNKQRTIYNKSIPVRQQLM
jgi:hypothetical protein